MQPSGFYTVAREDGEVQFDIPVDVAGDVINNTRTRYQFKFNGVLDMEATQEEVFDKVARKSVMRCASAPRPPLWGR